MSHSGIVVENLDETIWFYTSLLGFSEVQRIILEDDEVLRLLGIVDSKVTWSALAIDNQEPSLELLYIHNNDLRERYFDFKCEQGFLDFQHICIEVENIEDLFRRLDSSEATCISGPAIDSQCKYYTFFARDLDGYLLEFREKI